MEQTNNTRFYQQKHKIKQAINRFIFHLSIYGLFEVFLICLPFLVEMDVDLPLFIYYPIVVVLSIPVVFLAITTYKRYKSYKSIQKMENPLLEIFVYGFIYREDAYIEHNIKWTDILNVKLNEEGEGKFLNQELVIILKTNFEGVKNNTITIRGYKFEVNLKDILTVIKEYMSKL